MSFNVRAILLLIVALLSFLQAAVAAEVIPGADPLEATAAADLREALAGRDTPPIHLGTPDTHDAIAQQHTADPFTLTDNPRATTSLFATARFTSSGLRPRER